MTDIELKLRAAVHALRWIEFSPIRVGPVEMQLHAGEWARAISNDTPDQLLNRIEQSESMFDLYHRENIVTSKTMC
jgi:hypothetical protein